MPFASSQLFLLKTASHFRKSTELRRSGKATDKRINRTILLRQSVSGLTWLQWPAHLPLHTVLPQRQSGHATWGPSRRRTSGSLGFGKHQCPSSLGSVWPCASGVSSFPMRKPGLQCPGDSYLDLQSSLSLPSWPLKLWVSAPPAYLATDHRTLGLVVRPLR